MEKNKILEGLKNYNQEEVETFLAYLNKLETETKKDKVTGKQEKANPWFYYKTNEELIEAFKVVNKNQLLFDGKHITLQSTGVNFDYIALKNKMLLTYPESIIDLQLVYEGDEISFGKENGKIAYKHILANPFSNKEENIIGGYCIIKNKRGEFLTTLNREDIEKSRKVAKTDSIWKAWLKEMTLKTIIKKAVKIHFDDIYSEIIEIDNEENDLDNNPINIELSWKGEIDAIETIEELKKYWEINKGKGINFSKYITKRKRELEEIDLQK